MTNMRNENLICYVGYLFRFMLIFDIDRFQILDKSEDSIKARVGWPYNGTADYDEDVETQEIEWDIQIFENIEDTLELVDLLIDNRLMHSDKIKIDRDELYRLTRWKEEKFNKALDTLLNIKVDMVDNGKKNDFFFVHF